MKFKLLPIQKKMLKATEKYFAGREEIYSPILRKTVFSIKK